MALSDLEAAKLIMETRLTGRCGGARRLVAGAVNYGERCLAKAV